MEDMIEGVPKHDGWYWVQRLKGDERSAPVPALWEEGRLYINLGVYANGSWKPFFRFVAPINHAPGHDAHLRDEIDVLQTVIGQLREHVVTIRSTLEGVGPDSDQEEIGRWLKGRAALMSNPRAASEVRYVANVIGSGLWRSE